jgi:hypothetical protein
VASATLEAAGIQNSLVDTCTIGLVWTYSTALGWIRLSVVDQDLKAARDVLEPAESVEWPTKLEVDEGDERCRVCGSTDLEIVSGARKTLALMLITFCVPLWFWRSKLRCKACGSVRPVPIRIRPDLVIVWIIAALGATLFTCAVCLVAGLVIHGRV